MTSSFMRFVYSTKELVSIKIYKTIHNLVIHFEVTFQPASYHFGSSSGSSSGSCSGSGPGSEYDSGAVALHHSNVQGLLTVTPILRKCCG